MKPTVKVSIGGFGFNLEEDAYRILDEYLQTLNKHFENNAEASEIIADIEFRLSELLQMRINNNVNAVVSSEDAEAIISIMGKPSDFGADEEVESGDLPPKTEIKNKTIFDFKKKFYRDTNNAIIGGVFSGFGHYFKIDPTVLRLIYVGIIILFHFISNEVSVVAVFAYIVFWIIMPKAKTFNQKLSMTGTEPSIENIESRSQILPKSYRGSSINRVLKAIIKVLLVMLIISFSVAIIAVILGLLWLHFDTDIVGFNNYLFMLGVNSVYVNIAFAALVLLPLAGILGLFIKLLSKSPFTLRTIIIYAIGLIGWFISIYYISNLGFKHFYKEKTVDKKELVVNTNSETFYVKLSDDYMDAEPQPYNEHIYYRGNNTSKGRILFILPTVNIIKDSAINEIQIQVLKSGFGKNKQSVERKIQQKQLNYSVNDSLMLISPTWYSSQNPWEGVLYHINIRTPENKNVVVEKPLDFQYALGYRRE